MTNFRDGFSESITAIPDADNRRFLRDFVSRAWVATTYQWINEGKGSVHAAWVNTSEETNDGKPKVRLAQNVLTPNEIEVLVGDLTLTEVEEGLAATGEGIPLAVLLFILQQMVACPGNTYAQRLAVSGLGSNNDTMLSGDPLIVQQIRAKGNIRPGTKDKDGNCDPAPPSPNYKWRDKGNEHGGTLGFHWHWQEWNQNPETCAWFLSPRYGGPTDPSLLFPGRLYVQIPGSYP